MTNLREDQPADIDHADAMSVDPATAAPQAITPTYGSEVPPLGPRQDMFEIDVLAGGPVADRTSSPGTFTGGDSGKGLGGMANQPEAGVKIGAGVVGERIGI